MKELQDLMNKALTDRVSVFSIAGVSGLQVFLVLVGRIEIIAWVKVFWENVGITRFHIFPGGGRFRRHHNSVETVRRGRLDTRGRSWSR